MESYFQPDQMYTTWPVVYDLQAKPHKLVNMTDFEQVNSVYTNPFQNPYILGNLFQLEKTQLKNRPRPFRDSVLEKHGNCCAICGRQFSLYETPIELHHVLPRKFGGQNKPHNLVPLCREPCHSNLLSAVARRDLQAIMPYINLGVLELPSDFLESIPTDL